MIIINDYTTTRVTGCYECLAAELFHADSHIDYDTGEIGDTIEPHFGKSPCDICGETLAGHRFNGVILNKTTTVRGN